MTRATSPQQAPRATRAARPRRDERGVAYPSPLVALSIVAIAMAVIAFVATQQGPSGDSEVTTVSDSSPSPSATAPSPSAQKTAPAKPKKKPAPKPAVVRGDVLVEVYNNSGISGLAGQTGAKVQGAGWQLVDTDNWYGTIPASTVYYGADKKQAAELLAKDLGVSRVLPAVDPMRGDRLTVILTGDLG